MQLLQNASGTGWFHWVYVILFVLPVLPHTAFHDARSWMGFIKRQ